VERGLDYTLAKEVCLLIMGPACKGSPL
jgi:hypothetical protein